MCYHQGYQAFNLEDKSEWLKTALIDLYWLLNYRRMVHLRFLLSF